MTPLITELDPRVEEVLRRIAAEPESRLLRVDRKSMQRELHVDPARVGIAMPWLTSAERQLVQVHRLEVVELLKQCAAYRLLQDQREPRFLTSFDTSRGVDRAPTVRALRDAAQCLPDEGESDAEAVELVRRCVDPALASTVVTPGQLVAAALRLCPRADLVLMSGLCLLQDGCHAEALTQIGHAIRLESSSDLAAFNRINAALAFWNSGDPLRSWQFYVEATRLDPSRLAGWLGRFTLGGHLEYERDVIASAREIGLRTAKGSSVLEWYIEARQCRGGRGHATWNTAMRAHDALQSFASSCEPVRRLIDAHA
ncbi:MAG: hypothetical protein HZA53_15635 [Planctomycetes bacterium]|nr:hypothetical protein [Planctomycetota bacterium]